MNAELNYDDIRPYTDAELPSILDSLVNDRDFLWAIKSLRLSWMPAFLFPLFRPFLRSRLRQYTERLDTVESFQNAVEHYLQRCMDETSDALKIVGDDHLDSGKQYLFVSNHRDIVMDPALCNLAVHRLGRKTCRIAIGDNLLSKPFAEHLMRINKSFIVKRALGSGRERLKEMKKLSSFIRKSIVSDSECVWIAQREGRAKDGVDSSDPTLIKMLTLSKSKEQSFAEAVKQLNIMPVAVSYEWDPCDIAKARELAAKQENGQYQKSEHEDIESIAAGIQGYKGHVKLCFGDALQGEFETPEQVAAALDQQIHQMYSIHPSNLAAYQRQFGNIPSELSENYSETQLVAADSELLARLGKLTNAEADILLKMYANPVVSRLKLFENEELAFA